MRKLFFNFVSPSQNSVWIYFQRISFLILISILTCKKKNLLNNNCFFLDQTKCCWINSIRVFRSFFWGGNEMEFCFLLFQLPFRIYCNSYSFCMCMIGWWIVFISGKEKEREKKSFSWFKVCFFFRFLG